MGNNTKKLPVHLIVNVFNGEKYLKETLESLVKQDYPNVFIHCIDNHSTDSTAKIINSIGSEHVKLQIYMPPNHIPLVEARLFAISEILMPQERPFYFGFCDADDLWAPNWVSKLMAFSDKDYDLLISNGYYLVGQEKIPCDSCLSMARPSPFSCPVSIQSCLFQSNLIQDESPFLDKRFPIAYDTEFWLRRGKCLNYLHISDYLFYYRLHQNSMASTNFFPLLRERWGMLRLHNLSLVRFLFDFLRQLRSIMVSPK